jgi:iron complex outermembrane recepter protein
MVRFLLCSVGVMAFAAVAAAQDAPSAARPAASSTAPPQAEGEVGLSEIIVTAARRVETVQGAAFSIQALSEETLSRANVSKPEDLSSIAPTVQIGTAGAYPQAYIRGVGNYSTQVFAEGGVSFNLDGIYISRAWATRGMFYDLDRVEVIKGPQGTLYGRNASGGAINVITAKPTLGNTSGFAEVQAGNYDLIQGTAAVNLPLSDSIAVRASGKVVSRDGYLTDGYDDDKTQSGRLQLLWKPSDDLSLLLNGNYQHLGGKGGGAVLSPQLPGDKFRGSSDPAVAAIIQAQPFIGQLLTYPKGDGFLDVSVYAGGAELNWNLGFATLTVLPAYRDAKLHTLHFLAGFPVEDNEVDKQSSLEVRLGNDSEKLKWVLGTYYFDERQTNPPGRPTLFVPQGINAQITDDLDLQTRSYAAFGQATYSLTDRFRLTGGLRYTYEHKSNSMLIRNWGFPNPAPPPVCTGGAVFDPATPEVPLFCRVNIPSEAALTYNSVNYKAGVEYDLAPRSMAYANISTGFKSGGFYVAPPPNTFSPEKVTAVEAGMKNRFLENRLQVNVEGFYWDYRDHQESFVGPTSIPGFIGFITVNAGRAKSYGAEFDVQYRATADDELSLDFQLNKSEYTVFKFPYLTAVFGSPVTGCTAGPAQNGSQEVDCSGKPLLRAPRWTGTAGYSHSFHVEGHGDLTASLDTQFASSSYLSIDFLRSGQQGGYAVGNFDLTYTSSAKRWVVSAFVHNIWDEVVRTQAFRDPFVSPANPLANSDGFVIATVRAPRTFGGRVRFNF